VLIKCRDNQIHGLCIFTGITETLNLMLINMRKLFLYGLLLCIARISAAQSADEQILKPIQDLFKAMETADTILLRQAFHHDVALVTIPVAADGSINTLKRESTIDNFVRAIGKPRPEPLHEPIYNIKINQDGNFAQVWASYALFVGKNFHHCGIDTFQLIKTIAGWKIFYLADTRQTKDCNVPDDVVKKYSK